MTVGGAPGARVPGPLPALDALVRALPPRVLVAGPTGRGKTTLVTALAAATGREVVTADPGQPAFGPPGAVARAAWRDGWVIRAVEPLGTLDVFRFRLPLVLAVRRLARAPGAVLVDAPGVYRGPVAGELIAALAEAAAVDAVVILARGDEADTLSDAVAAAGLPALRYAPSHAARDAPREERAARRTARWDAWLGDAADVRLPPVPVLGAPEDPETWPGRQVVLLGARSSLAEVTGFEGGALTVRGPAVAAPRAVLVRDARRERGLLHTSRPGGPQEPPAPVARVGAVSLAMAGALFDDPFLMLRFVNEARVVFFDLGDPGRLPARLAHLVTDVFVTHAHLDHFSGFLWLLRCRVGVATPCRLFGPPGLGARVASFVDAFTWDRIGEGGPRFEVREVHGGSLRRVDVQAGRAPEARGEHPAPGGVLLDEPAFRVRAATLDHAGIPVLAYAYEEPRSLKIRRERLHARGLPPGPWLGELKRRLHAGERNAELVLPDGTVATVQALADELVIETPGERLAYATDVADTPENRERLVALARHARLFVCEATFVEADAAQAARTGHLTARACGAIAAAAEVEQLLPVHFSRRYEGAPEVVWREVGFPRLTQARVAPPYVPDPDVTASPPPSPLRARDT